MCGTLVVRRRRLSLGFTRIDIARGPSANAPCARSAFHKLRFIMSGKQNLPPGSPGEVIPPSEPVAMGPDEWGVSTASVGFAIDLDPAIFIDRMTRAVLAHTRDSLLEGKRPDTGGDQKPLSRQALAVDRQSEHRGYRTGHLADNIRRTTIKRSGTEASASIAPPQNRNVYVSTERARVINLLTLAGRSGDAARAAAQGAVAEIAEGGKVPVNDREVDAEDAT